MVLPDHVRNGVLVAVVGKGGAGFRECAEQVGEGGQGVRHHDVVAVEVDDHVGAGLLRSTVAGHGLAAVSDRRQPDLRIVGADKGDRVIDAAVIDDDYFHAGRDWASTESRVRTIAGPRL